MDLFDLFARISLDTSGFTSGLESAGKLFKNFSDNIAVKGFQNIEKVGKKAGEGISNALKVFGAASTAVGGFGAAAVKSGMNFDSTMSEVSAISGATGKDFDSLRDKALEMGAKTKFSASEAAEAMTYMGMAGWKAGDMIGGIEGIMNLAAASGEDLATTSDIVTDALTAFGNSASDAGTLADILAATATNANTDVGMMGETFKYVAPVAGALGYTMGETAAAIGLMANAGIKSSQAGTSLRSIMTRLSTNAGATSKSMGALEIMTKKLGVEFYNTDGTARNLLDVIYDSREAWKGLSEEQAITYAKTIAGQEAMSGWLALMDASDKDVDKLTDAIVDCNGAAEEMSKIMNDNLQGDLILLGSAFETLKIAIYDSIKPTLREFAQFGQKAMANLLEGFQGGGVSGLMNALSKVVTDAVTFLAGKAPEFVAVSGQFIAALAEGFLNGRDKITTAANDILIMFRDGLSSWLSQNSQSLIEFGNEMLRILFQGFLTAGDIISENIGKFIPLLANGFASYHESLFTVGLDILGAIGRGIVENKDEIKSIASDTIANMAKSLRENAPDIVDGAIALLEALVEAFLENKDEIIAAGKTIVGHLIEGITQSGPALGVAIGVLLPHIGKIVDAVKNVGGAVGKVIDVVKNLGSGLRALWGILSANPIAAVIAIVAALVAGLVTLWNTSEDFRNAVKRILEDITGFFKSAYEVITGSFKGAVDFFSGVVDGIKGAFDGIGEFLGGLFVSAYESAKSAFSDIKQKASDTAQDMKSKFKDACQNVKTLWNAAGILLGEIFSNIKEKSAQAAEKIQTSFKKAYENVKSKWDGAIAFFSGIRDKIINVFSNIGSKFKEIGGNILKGLWNGISDKIAWLKSKVSGVVDKIKSWFTGKSGFDEHSPSKWAKQVFRYVMEGGGQGLEAGIPALMRSVSGVVDNVKDGMQFSPASGGIANTLRGFFAGSGEELAALGQEIAGMIVSGFSTAGEIVAERVGGFIAVLAEGFAAQGEALWAVGLEMLRSVGLGFTESVDETRSITTQTVANLVTGFTENIPQLVEVGTLLTKGLIDGMIQAIANIPAAVEQVVTAIVDGFKDLFGIEPPSTVFMEMGNALIAGLLEGISDTWVTIVDFFTEETENLIEMLNETWEAIKNFAAVAWSGIRDVIADAWQMIKSDWSEAEPFFEELWSVIGDGGSKAADKVKKAFKKAWETVKSAWGGATEFFRGIHGKIISVFSDMGEEFKEIGSNIVKGLQDGVSDNWGDFLSWLSSKVDDAADDVKEKLDAKKTSKSESKSDSSNSTKKTSFKTKEAKIQKTYQKKLKAQTTISDYDTIKRKINDSISPKSSAINRQYAGSPSFRKDGGSGNSFSVNIYSPVAVDAVKAAREWKKTAQRMTLGYV